MANKLSACWDKRLYDRNFFLQIVSQVFYDCLKKNNFFLFNGSLLFISSFTAPNTFLGAAN